MEISAATQVVGLLFDVIGASILANEWFYSLGWSHDRDLIEQKLRTVGILVQMPIYMERPDLKESVRKLLDDREAIERKWGLKATDRGGGLVHSVSTVESKITDRRKMLFMLGFSLLILGFALQLVCAVANIS